MVEKNIIRFFDYQCEETPCFAKYENDNIIVPRVGEIVWVDTEFEPYRVDDVTYSYDENNTVMVDVFVSHADDFLDDDNKEECGCSCCHHGDAEREDDEPNEGYNLSDVFTALMDAFSEFKDLNVSVTISGKDEGEENVVYC